LSRGCHPSCAADNHVSLTFAQPLSFPESALMDFIFTLIGATLRISTPILFAALGETIIERSGVLNLGIEGTMMMSAFTGFFAAQTTGSLFIGLIAAILTGIILNLLM